MHRAGSFERWSTTPASPPKKKKKAAVALAARDDAFDLARMERVIRTNVIGSFLCAREAVRRMSSRHGGRGGAIVNLSSVAARLGSPAEDVDYAASKELPSELP